MLESLFDKVTGAGLKDCCKTYLLHTHTHTKCSLKDVCLGSKYTSASLDAQCKVTPPNSFILQYLCHNQFAFCF